jgi:hypothetical protein
MWMLPREKDLSSQYSTVEDLLQGALMMTSAMATLSAKTSSCWISKSSVRGFHEFSLTMPPLAAEVLLARSGDELFI